jgi:hypothetical protein
LKIIPEKIAIEFKKMERKSRVEKSRPSGCYIPRVETNERE